MGTQHYAASVRPLVFCSFSFHCSRSPLSAPRAPSKCNHHHELHPIFSLIRSQRMQVAKRQECLILQARVGKAASPHLIHHLCKLCHFVLGRIAQQPRRFFRGLMSAASGRVRKLRTRHLSLVHQRASHQRGGRHREGGLTGNSPTRNLDLGAIPFWNHSQLRSRPILHHRSTLPSKPTTRMGRGARHT